MAKKKKKAAKKKAGGAAAAREAEVAVCSDQELIAAGFVTTAGELVARFGEAIVTAIEARGISISELVTAGLNSLQNEGASRTVSGDENADRRLVRLREYFIDSDYAEMPYLRVVGKVVEVLTVHRRQHRGKDSCSVGDVFRVFLTEIPEHSPYDPDDYKLARPTRRGNEYDLTLDPGKTMFSDRLKDLKDNGWLMPASTTRSGGERGYRLSEDGRWLFDRWPEVEGLQNAPPPPQPATE